MKIAIHNSKVGFHPRWKTFCENNDISYKMVNCYESDIIEQLKKCDALLWHHSHSRSDDILFAKQLLYALEKKGITVFPNYNTTWHFDDKVGQKYLLEAIDAPLVPSSVFYSKDEALKWIKSSSYPKVFKLRGGAGSKNVKLITTERQAIKLVKKAFGKGFRQYEPWSNLKERWRQYLNKQTDLYDVFKGVLRFFKEPEYSKTIGYERGYVYFQDFIPNNDSDIRVIVIGNRAFAVKRLIRKNDFRASGSGNKEYEKEKIDIRTIKIAFKVANKIQTQSIGFDFVFDINNNPLIVEIGYAFAIEFYDPCPGYWDEDLNWYEGSFIPQEWMIEDVLVSIQSKIIKND